MQVITYDLRLMEPKVDLPTPTLMIHHHWIFSHLISRSFHVHENELYFFPKDASHATLMIFSKVKGIWK